MSDEPVRDEGFSDWIDAAEAGAASYLECPAGHGSLPPRRVCPVCGATELTEASLPQTGEVETFTVTHVPMPAFAEDAPYATAVARFGPVRLTGQIVDSDLGAIENGLAVELAITVSETTGERVIGFRPV